MSAVEVRVVSEDGEDASVGELLCRSPAIMNGYHKDDALTAETVVDGWLRTGDIVRIDAELRTSSSSTGRRTSSRAAG